MNFKNELDIIERKVNKNKEEKIKLSERKKHLTEEKDKIISELKKEGIEESKLEDLIIDLEMEIQEKLEKCNEILK